MTVYSGGAMRLSVNASNVVPTPKIAWNFKGKSPSIAQSDPRFYVLPNGVLQVYGLTSADAGQVRAAAQASTGVKSKDMVIGTFQEVTILSGKLFLSNLLFSAVLMSDISTI